MGGRRTALAARRCGQVARCPLPELGEDGQGALAAVGEAVRNADGRTGHDVANDELSVGAFGEPFGQDRVADAPDRASEPVPATAWADIVTSGFIEDSQRTTASARHAPRRPRSPTSWSRPTHSCSSCPRTTTGSRSTSRPGSPREGRDHSSPWLQRALEDVWGLELRVVQRPFTLVGVNPVLDAFTDVAGELKLVAEADAVRSGREFAEIVAGTSAA